MYKLYNCPFCGSSSASIRSHDEVYHYGGQDSRDWRVVLCLKCGAMSGSMPTIEGVIEKWNGRVKMGPSVQKVSQKITIIKENANEKSN